MEDPKFEELTVAELECFIQENGRKVDELRAQNLKAHTVLEEKESLARAQTMANRPGDFPPAQGVGKPN